MTVDSRVHEGAATPRCGTGDLSCSSAASAETERPRVACFKFHLARRRARFSSYAPKVVGIFRATSSGSTRRACALHVIVVKLLECRARASPRGVTLHTKRDRSRIEPFNHSGLLVHLSRVRPPTLVPSRIKSRISSSAVHAAAA